jgi:hypothetical protein
MSTLTVAIDLAKTVFEVAAADSGWRVVERRRFSRSQLERYLATRCHRPAYWSQGVIGI